VNPGAGASQSLARILRTTAAPRVVALASTLSLLCACAERTVPAPCSFGEERLLATVSPQIEDIALAEAVRGSANSDVHAVWSSRDGTFLRALAPDGSPRSDAHRLGPSCAGGVALARTDDATWVACLRRGRPAKDDPGGVVLWRHTRGDTRQHATFGQAGPEAHGIALVAEAHALMVLWQDTSDGRTRILRADIPRSAAPRLGADDVDTRTLSVDALDGTGPTLTLRDGHAIAAWGEVGSAPDGRTFGRIVVDAGRGPVDVVDTLSFDAPMPQLLAHGTDDLALAYRDTTSRRDKSGLYVVSLGARLRPIAPPRRIARANGPGGPALAACAGSIFAVAPRTYQRDLLVGITRLTPDLTARGREQQLYEDGRAFAHAAIACTPRGPLLVTGERGTATRPEARLLATPLSCRSD
jgi:hypothetical protein